MKIFLIPLCSFLAFQTIIFSNHSNDVGNPDAYIVKDTNRIQIPVLCYHNITENGEKEDLLWIGKDQFYEQLKMLHDSGYHTILPGQLYNYLVKGTPLPSKPIMLTFDDSHKAHFSIAWPIMQHFGFKGVFFIMTVCIGKKHYLSAQEIKALSENGNVIGCHTFDHPVMNHLKGDEWEKEINMPTHELERITGHKVQYFAYPYGAWNDTAVVELKDRGVKAAFQLTGRMSQDNPLYTIRRMMVSGRWSGEEMQKRFLMVFKNK
jgi:peptidoglycan/xylan/chitin deacetylase (PgdA/CDA1 family)